MELEKVLFVIVLYRQALRSSAAYQSIASFFDNRTLNLSLFVYDNSPEADCDIPGSVMYFHDPSNPGVSRAYNTAFRYARASGFEFLLLMDQDSIFPRSTVHSYRQAVAENPNVHVFAPVARSRRKTFSPFRLVRGRGFPLPRLKAGIHSLKKVAVINSGLMVSVTAFERCGGYDERFALDFSDIDFCYRLANYNFQLCLINGSIIHEHSSKSRIALRSRFDTYLKAVVLFKHLSNKRISYWFTGFPRAVKLSAQLRDGWFLVRFFNPGT